MLRRVWQRLEDLQPPGEVSDGLLIRAPRQGIRRRLLQIRHGPLGVPPARKVHGEGRRVLADPSAIARRFAAPNAPMQARPVPRPEPLIHHLLIQRMAKPIAPTHGPIRPLHQAPVFQELPLPRQPLTHHLHGVRSHLHPRRYTGHRELRTRYTPPSSTCCSVSGRRPRCASSRSWSPCGTPWATAGPPARSAAVWAAPWRRCCCAR